MFQYLLLLETDKEKEFFASIYEAHRDEMFFIAYSILHNRSDAEDAVHESFLSLIDHVNKIIDKQPYQAWHYMKTTVKHKSYNIYRQHHLHEEVELDETWMQEKDTEKGPELLMEDFELQEAMTGLLKQLKTPYQEMLALQYYHQMTPTEIAEQMGTTPDNVRHISMRAKRKLQSLMKENGMWNEKAEKTPPATETVE